MGADPHLEVLQRAAEVNIKDYFGSFQFYEITIIIVKTNML